MGKTAESEQMKLDLQANDLTSLEIGQAYYKLVGLFQQGKIDESDKMLPALCMAARRFVRTDAGELSVLYWSIARQIEQGKGQEAELACRDLIRFRTTKVDRGQIAIEAVLLAASLELQQQKKQSAQLYAKAMAEAPDTALAEIDLLRNGCTIQGDQRQAAVLLQHAQALENRSPNKKYAAAVLARQAIEQLTKHNRSKGDELANQLLALSREGMKSNSGTLSQALTTVGDCYANLDMRERSAPFYSRNLELWRKTSPSNYPMLVEALLVMADNYRGLHDQKTAMPMYKEAQQICLRSIPQDAQLIHQVRLRTGDSLQLAGKLKDAASVYEQDLELCQSSNIPQSELCDAEFRLGRVLFFLGDLQRAKPHLERSLELAEQISDSAKSQRMHQRLNGLAELIARDDPREAAKIYQRDLDLCKNPDLKLGNAAVANDLVQLSRTSFSQGDHQQAVSYAQQALAIIDHDKLPADALTDGALFTLGDSLVGVGKFHDAQPIFERADALSRTSDGALAIGAPEVANVHMRLAANCFRIGQEQRGFKLIDEAIKICERSARADTSRVMSWAVTICQSGTNKTALADAYLRLANNQCKLGQLSEAEANARKAVAIYKEVPGVHREALSRGYCALATALRLEKKYDEALRFSQQNVQMLKSEKGLDTTGRNTKGNVHN